MEIIVSVVSLVSRLRQVALLKYAGSFLGILTVLFFLRVYCYTSEKRERGIHVVGVAFAALSPWFIAFDSYLVHQTVGFLLLAALLLALVSNANKSWGRNCSIGNGGSYHHACIHCIRCLNPVATTRWTKMVGEE